MQLVFEDKKKRVVKDKETVTFSSFSSYHLVEITARAKSEKQLGGIATDDEELTVNIDGKGYPKLGTKEALLDSPAAFNGGKLHNYAKTIYFLTYLKGKDHSVILKTDNPPNTGTFEGIRVSVCPTSDKLELLPNFQAEDGNNRPWVNFSLDNVPLLSFALTITHARRKRDSDDVKVIIDNQVQENILRNIKHFLWSFVGSFIPLVSPIKTETQTFNVNLPESLHYLELEADRMPTLEKIVFDFGTKLPVPEGIPIVDNPKWTGDFYDDSPEILLSRLVFGEARNQSKEAKIGVAWSVKNRLLAKRSYFGFSYHEIILKNDGENFQFASMNPNDSSNFPALTDPLGTQEQATGNAWFDSYQAAVGVIGGATQDPTDGGVFFHSSDLSQEEFVKDHVPGAIYIKQIGDFLFYKSPS